MERCQLSGKEEWSRDDTTFGLATLCNIVSSSGWMYATIWDTGLTSCLLVILPAPHLPKHPAGALPLGQCTLSAMHGKGRRGVWPQPSPGCSTMSHTHVWTHNAAFQSGPMLPHHCICQQDQRRRMLLYLF